MRIRGGPAAATAGGPVLIDPLPLPIEYLSRVSTMECPKCYLPKDDSAWQCDGCGYEFSQDFESVRSTLRAQLRTSRIVFWVTLIVSFGVVGVVVYLATHGWIYISVPLMLAVVGSIGHAAHKISVLRDHLRSLDRRHVSLPKATAHRVPGGDPDQG
jgi:hypothetical protein